MTKVSYNVTSVGEAPGAERGQRMKKYVITMSIRMACILAMPFVDGWWILVCALGAVFLPYVAVIIANVRLRGLEGEGVEHATLELAAPPTTEFAADGSSEVIIVDDGVIRVTSIERVAKEDG